MRHRLRDSGRSIPGPDRIGLRYETLTIDVGADEGAPLAWLSEFLAPAFQAVPSDPSAADHLVLFETTPAKHAMLRNALASAPPETFEGFTYDGHFSRHPGWSLMTAGSGFRMSATIPSTASTPAPARSSWWPVAVVPTPAWH